jgi:DNA-binding NarL/FixJ family response regulator
MVQSSLVETSKTVESGKAPDQSRLRVVIAEDHPVMRDGVIDLLQREPAVELVGCAATANQVDELIRAEDPEILVLDLTLGCDDGVEVARRLLKSRPQLRIIVLSMHDEIALVDRLLSMGVLAYLTKNRTTEEFLAALQSVLQGQVYLTTDQRERLRGRTASPHFDFAGPEGVLSEREMSVLRLLASGKNSREIARELSVAPKTVYSHRRNISSKLGISTGRQMLRYAVHWAHGSG